MNQPPQPPLSEEPEQQPVHHVVEEAAVVPAPASELHAEEAEPVGYAAEAAAVEPASVANEPLQETAQAAHTAAEEDVPTQPAISIPAAETSTQDEEFAEKAPVGEVPVTEENDTVVSEEDAELDEEDAELDDEELEPEPEGVFIRKSILIAAACAVVLVALLVGLFVFVNRPKDPPTDWIASTPPSIGSGAGNTLYYLHWTNQNSALKGQIQLAVSANGVPRSLTFPAEGVYNRDNHIIYVVFTVNGQPATLSGKISDNNDILTLNQVGATTQDGQLTFHTGSADDYAKAKNALNKKTGTK